MNYSTRLKRKANKVQLRITIEFTQEELDGVNRIADDKYVGVDIIKQHDPELSLAYARTLCFWCSMWNNSDQSKLINMAIKRKQAEKRWLQRKEKKRARRTRKK